MENMLEDVVNALDLSDVAIETHGPLGTSPSELVRIVLAQKDATIKMLRAGMVDCTHNSALCVKTHSQETRCESRTRGGLNL